MDPKPQAAQTAEISRDDQQAKAQAIAAALLVGVDDSRPEQSAGGATQWSSAAEVGSDQAASIGSAAPSETSPVPVGADGWSGPDGIPTLVQDGIPDVDEFDGTDSLAPGPVATEGSFEASDASAGDSGVAGSTPADTDGGSTRRRSGWGFRGRRSQEPKQPKEAKEAKAPKQPKEPRKPKEPKEPAATISELTGWKVAAGFLTILAVVLAGWAAYETAARNSAQSAAAATVAAQAGELDTRVSNLETTAAQLTNDVEAVQAQLSDASAAASQAVATGKAAYQEVQQSVAVAEQTYQDAVNKSKQLAQLYAADLAAAKAAVADQSAQIKSLESQLALAKNCAILFAGTLQKVYTAASPADAMPQAAQQLATVAPECKMILE